MRFHSKFTYNIFKCKRLTIYDQCGPLFRGSRTPGVMTLRLRNTALEYTFKIFVGIALDKCVIYYKRKKIDNLKLNQKDHSNVYILAI